MAKHSEAANAEGESHQAMPTDMVDRLLKGSRRHPFRLGLVLGALVTVSIGLLIAQNGESAQLDWAWFHFRAPLWIMLLLTLASGAVVWELLKAVVRRARRRQARRREALVQLRDVTGGDQRAT